METKLFKIESPDGDLTSRDIDAIKECAQIIKNGGLVAFPTETVYGLGGDALNEGSSAKIYAAKGRPSDNPLIVHISDIRDLQKIAVDIPEEALALAEKFWPGPLTMVLKASPLVPRKTTGGLDTVAVRFPDNAAALELIRRSGGFIAAPSANTSGKPSPTNADYVLEDMNGRIDAVIDGGTNRIGLESTIVDLSGGPVQVLRPGFVTNEMLSDALGIEVGTDPAIMDPDSGKKPKAPGMKYRHYAPKGEVIPVKGDPGRVCEHILEGLGRASGEGKKTGVICCKENVSVYEGHADQVLHAGSLDDADDIARLFYEHLRFMDDRDVEVIYVENFTDLGFGAALWNRLLKAAGSKWEEAK